MNIAIKELAKSLARLFQFRDLVHHCGCCGILSVADRWAIPGRALRCDVQLHQIFLNHRVFHRGCSLAGFLSPEANQVVHAAAPSWPDVFSLSNTRFNSVVKYVSGPDCVTIDRYHKAASRS